ncbi:MAG: hypothetical protein ABSE08_14550 [Syntrophobacteraceae bacterium]|jgi:hypothetical protein
MAKIEVYDPAMCCSTGGLRTGGQSGVVASGIQPDYQPRKCTCVLQVALRRVHLVNY